MDTAEFDFDLPRELIAQRPIQPRDAARLLVVGARLDHRRIAELPEILEPGDALVYNDTRVIPARLTGRRDDAKIEVTLHRPAEVSQSRWYAFAKPARRLKAGQRIDFAPGFSARVVVRGERGEVELAFDCDPAELREALDLHGSMPLPPYIRRQGVADAADRADYQTLFARHEGAVAAPTAGLHFTEALIAALARRGIETHAITLHVGAGTFLPVTAERAEDHVMHGEYGEIGAPVAEAIARAKARGGRIVAVGTTVLRLLETAARESGRVVPFAGTTDLFILPGFRFRAVDLLLTNFHLPRSTLFMLVCAFAGTARMKAAYEVAKREGYRFYSYGDACLLEPAS